MKTNRPLLLIILALFLITFFSCKSTSSRSSILNIATDIDGSWKLSSLKGYDIKKIFSIVPTLTVDLSTQTIYGNAGCNNYNGSFNLLGNIFSAPSLITTRMMCSNYDGEIYFLSILRNPHKVSINENNTLILKEQNDIVAEFTKDIDETMLLGKWTLEFMKDSDIKSLFSMGSSLPTLEFNLSAKQLYGNAGCNSYSASFDIDYTTIVVGSILSTRMSCPNLEGEYKFTNLLSDINELKIHKNELFFFKNGELILKLKRH